MKIIFFLVLVFKGSLLSDDMTVERYNEIFNGKVTKEIREELTFIPTFDAGVMDITFKRLNKEPLVVKVPCESKYIDGKYIVFTATLKFGQTVTSIYAWDKKSNSLVKWNLAPKNKIWALKFKKVKGNSYKCSGKATDGTTYKGKSEYFKDKITFQGDYFIDGVNTHSEKATISNIE